MNSKTVWMKKKSGITCYYVIFRYTWLLCNFLHEKQMDNRVIFNNVGAAPSKLFGYILFCHSLTVKSVLQSKFLFIISFACIQIFKYLDYVFTSLYGGAL